MEKPSCVWCFDKYRSGDHSPIFCKDHTNPQSCYSREGTPNCYCEVCNKDTHHFLHHESQTDRLVLRCQEHEKFEECTHCHTKKLFANNFSHSTLDCLQDDNLYSADQMFGMPNFWCDKCSKKTHHYWDKCGPFKYLICGQKKLHNWKAHCDALDKRRAENPLRGYFNIATGTPLGEVM